MRLKKIFFSLLIFQDSNKIEGFLMFDFLTCGFG
ncbi:hypothetical protein FPSM_00202 [Flavobacterium psychrophilum]|nr:hypothetical protein FPSM_00202 [Flavobacterium psychrophilum]